MGKSAGTGFGDDREGAALWRSGRVALVGLMKPKDQASPGAGANQEDCHASKGRSSCRQRQALASLSAQAGTDEAHMVVGMASGVDLMNARTNVFLPQFWNLHFFINARFEKQLPISSTSSLATGMLSLWSRSFRPSRSNATLT
jgi:hypothetical protein